MTDEEQPKSGKDKPLIGATPVGAAIVGIPIASVMAFMGWAGQKVLLIDETVVEVNQHLEVVVGRQEKHEAQLVALDASIGGTEERIGKVEETLEARGGRLERALRDLMGTIERVVKNEALLGDAREEQLRIRNVLSDLSAVELRWLEERLRLLEQRFLEGGNNAP